MNKNISSKRNTNNQDVYNQENIPTLRFPEFNDEWETKIIKHIFKERTEKGYVDLELLSVTLDNGVIKRSQIEYKDNSSFDKSKYKHVLPTDIVYNSMRMWQGASGVSEYEGIVSPAYTILIPNNEINSCFYGYYFKKYNMIYEFRKYSQGLTSDTWNLKYPLISKIKIQVPKFEEQTKIAAFLLAIDKKIDLMEKKHTQYKKLKKYLLQNLLPFNEKTPKIRFKEFSDEWKICKLDDLTKINVGFVGSISKYYTSTSEGIPVLSTKNITDKGIELDNINYVTPDFHIKNKKSQLFSQDLIIARHGNSGSAFIIPDKLDKSQALNVVIIRRSKNFISNFMKNFFNSTYISRKMYGLKAGSVQGVVNTKEIEKIKVIIPSIEEQEKISSVLLNVDKRIILTSENINLLKQFKTGLLQQMFC